jgi:Rad3-related DNA helicase
MYRGDCYYRIAKEATLASPLKILNNAYCLTEFNGPGRFSGESLVIIDEADALENVLIGFVSLSFTERSLYRLGLTEGPSRKTPNSKEGVDPWKQFGQEALSRATMIIYNLNKEIESWQTTTTDEQLKTMRERDYFTNLASKAKMFVDNVDPTWKMEETERRGSTQGKITFRPLWVTPQLADTFLWRHAENWVLMSASFLPIQIECQRLGIDRADVDYKCLPSTFDPQRRQIHITPIANITAKTYDAELPKLITEIGRISNLPQCRSSKGLIHAVSYRLSQNIVDGVKDERFITHDSRSRADVLQYFIDSPDPLVLVSPSMERGVSFNDELCRWIIVAKMPFLSIGDKIVSARIYSSRMGKSWYLATALNTVLQQTGRGMRSEDDWCESWILDEQFNRVFREHPSWMPQWWRDAEAWD